MRATFKDRDGEREPEEQSSLKTPEQRSSSEVKEAHGKESQPESLAPAQSAVLGLQRSHGNQFVVRMLQRKCSCGGTCPKCSAEREADAPAATGAFANYIEHPGGGQPLDSSTRDTMESRLGHDFSDVRVHSDGAAADAARALDSQAFTVGSDVFFAGGKYRGDAADPLLAHELTHVAQQSAGGTSTTGAGLEEQAERAERVVAGDSGGVEISGGARGVQRKSGDGASTGAPAQPAKPPSFLERVGHSIAGAAETVMGGIKAAGSAIAEGAQAVGHAVATAGEAIWNGLQWVGKQLWSKVTGVYERIMHWVMRLPARLARLVTGLWEGVKTMHPWALEWWESLGKADTWTGFLQWLGANFLQVLEALGIGEAYETAMDFVKFNTRELSGGELSKAHSVFGASIDLGLVRVDEHAALGPAFTNRAYTSFHTINNWGSVPDATLIHELTHVWQYQQAGAIYMAQAAHAQIQFGSAAYDFDVHELRTAKQDGRGFLSFNREKQAQIVEDFYRLKTNQPVFHSDGTPADLPLYAHFVKAVSTRSEAELVT
jgi:hypothetical protein